MAKFVDLCKFNPVTGDSADWTFSTAVQGFQSPTAANMINGGLYVYRAESGDFTQWELGRGTYTSSTGILTRTTILFSSSSNAKVNFTNTPTVSIVAAAEDLPSLSENNTFAGTNTFGGVTLGTGLGATLTSPSNNLLQITASGNVTDNIGTSPVTKTSAYSVAASDKSIIFNGSGSITLTLPSASTSTGRELWLKTIAAFTVISASSNVVPIGSTTPGTAILAATIGKYAVLVSDGTNWITMNAN